MLDGLRFLQPFRCLRRREGIFILIAFFFCFFNLIAHEIGYL